MSDYKGSCFVIMSFSEDENLRLSYKYGVKQTVESLGYFCERMDEKYFNGMIYDEIIEGLQQASFIIADLTHAKPNCYYELGIAHALGKVVIHLINVDEKIEFDVQGFKFIKYKHAEDLENQLRPHLQHTITNLKRNILFLTQEHGQTTTVESEVLHSLPQDVHTITMQLPDRNELDTQLEQADIVLYSYTVADNAHEKAELLIDALQRQRVPKHLVVYANEDMPSHTYRLLTGYRQAPVSKMQNTLLEKMKVALK